MHPTGSYCANISRCAVHRTLNHGSVSLKNWLMQRCNLYRTHCFTLAASSSSITEAPTVCFIVASTCCCILSSFLPHISLFHITEICCKYPQLQVALTLGLITSRAWALSLTCSLKTLYFSLFWHGGHLFIATSSLDIQYYVLSGQLLRAVELFG